MRRFPSFEHTTHTYRRTQWNEFDFRNDCGWTVIQTPSNGSRLNFALALQPPAGEPSRAEPSGSEQGWRADADAGEGTHGFGRRRRGSEDSGSGRTGTGRESQSPQTLASAQCVSSCVPCRPTSDPPRSSSRRSVPLCTGEVKGVCFVSVST